MFITPRVAVAWLLTFALLGLPRAPAWADGGSSSASPRGDARGTGSGGSRSTPKLQRRWRLAGVGAIALALAVGAYSTQKAPQGTFWGRTSSDHVERPASRPEMPPLSAPKPREASRTQPAPAPPSSAAASALPKEAQAPDGSARKGAPARQADAHDFFSLLAIAAASLGVEMPPDRHTDH